MKPDVLSILEAAYAPAPTPEAWLARLVADAGPVLDRGMGLVGYTYRASDDGRVALGAAVDGEPPPPSWARGRAEAMLASLNPHDEGRRMLARIYPRAPVSLLFSEMFAPQAADPSARRARRVLETASVDLMGVLGGDPSGHGAVLCAWLPVGTRLPPAERVLWTRVAAHLASAYRLQRSANAATVDAVLHTDGRVAHAEPAAQSAASRAALRAETRAMDTARGPLRRADPDEALAVWKGLVAGQWSLVDQVDSDGRRYVYARRNAPAVRAWAALSERERQVLAYAAEGLSYKATAYVLGVSPATVSTHLRRAAHKVGVGSRLALVRAFTARAPGAM